MSSIHFVPEISDTSEVSDTVDVSEVFVASDAVDVSEVFVAADAVVVSEVFVAADTVDVSEVSCATDITEPSGIKVLAFTISFFGMPITSFSGCRQFQRMMHAETTAMIPDRSCDTGIVVPQR